MALPEMRSSCSVPSDTTNEVPLLSDDERNFLAGKIDAEKYVDTARRQAVAQAEREFYKYLRERRRRRSSGVRIILGLAAIAYVILGVVTAISSKDVTASSVTAFVTAALAAAGAFFRFSND